MSYPIAQSFMVQESGGCFITSLDLYFHTKDNNNAYPVTVQLREMQNGAPTPRILPFGEVILKPSDINAYDPATELPDPNRVTKFTFPSPVYLQENQEYCFVVLSNSSKYNLWFAEIGQEQFREEGTLITKQPFAGVMFVSYNDRTFVADQNKDLKFRLHRADFDISDQGEIILENGVVQPVRLSRDPFVTTINSTKVRVLQKNHGFFDEVDSIQSEVTITGVEEDVGGIPADEFNGTHIVDDVEQDSYTITVSTAATSSGLGGGDGAPEIGISATQNQIFNTLHPYIQELNLPGTSSAWAVRTVPGVSLGQSSPTPYSTSNSSYVPVSVNDSTNFGSVRVIASSDNQSAGKSLFLRGTLSSNRTNISPVIDLDRASVITIQNRIDNSEASTGTDNLKNKVDNFVAETAATGGSALAKYVTKNVILNDPSDGLRVFVDVHRPTSTFLDLYYKAADSEDQLYNTVWTLQEPLDPIPFTDDFVTFEEIEYIIDPTNAFQAFAIKIVMRSLNSSNVPLVRDLRVISIVP